MFRRAAVLSILASIVVTSTASADLTFTASASPVSIPVILNESPISDRLVGYGVLINFSLPAGVTLSGATDKLGNGGFFIDATLPSADLRVLDHAGLASVPPNVSSPTTTLFTIEFDVTTSGTGDFTRAILHTGDENGLQYDVPNPAYTGPLGPFPEFVTENVPFTFITDGTSMVITAVPEPSQWILGFLMTGLLGTIVSKKWFLGKRKRTVTTDN
ncbi:hypothetical protein ACFL2H_07425 [Planctomycetota bacterium]